MGNHCAYGLLFFRSVSATGLMPDPVEFGVDAARCKPLESCDTSAAGIGNALSGFARLYKAVPNCPAAIPSS